MDKYNELKQFQMHQDRPKQEIVRKQALERLQEKVKAMEEESSRFQNDSIANMASMDHHTLTKNEERRQT